MSTSTYYAAAVTDPLAAAQRDLDAPTRSSIGYCLTCQILGLASLGYRPSRCSHAPYGCHAGGPIVRDLSCSVSGVLPCPWRAELVVYRQECPLTSCGGSHTALRNARTLLGIRLGWT